MSPEIELEVGGGLLRVVTIERFDIDLDAFKVGNVRLVVLADALLEEPLIHYCFEKSLGRTSHGRRGLLTSVRPDLPALVLDLAPVADQVREWLADGNAVTVALHEPLAMAAALVAAVVGVTTGQSPVEAIAAVESALPGALKTVDEEIAVSVARDHWLAHRDLERRRAELRAQGRSPWEAQ